LISYKIKKEVAKASGPTVRSQVESNVPVPEGRHKLRFEFEVTGKPGVKNGKGAPGCGLIKWGVDILIPFPSSIPPMDMVRKFRKDVPDDIPCLILGGQDSSAEEYWNMGYNLIFYHLIGIFAAAKAVQREFQNIKEKGKWTLSAQEYAAARRLIDESISLPEYYQIEEKTTEKKK
jgi:hypothetical protein